MLTAIGVLIILKQIPHAFGYDADTEGDMTFLQTNGENTFSALLQPLNHIHLGATIIALISLTILLLWEKPFIKNKLGFIPGGLVAVGLSILLNELFIQTGSALSIASTHLVNVPAAGNFSEFLGFFTFPDFSQITNYQVWVIGATIAIVASIETLLCIEAVDKLDPMRRSTSTNLELKAQGFGNVLSGLIGGLPITSVIVRSSANVNAGAKTKLSAIFHGLLLLTSVLLIPSLLNKIPLASLAAILLITGYKLAKPALFKEMFKNGKYQWVPFVVTVVAIVFTDLLKGVGVGLVVSVFYILKGNLKHAYYFHKENHHEGDLIQIKLSEEVSFLNKASIKQTLYHLPENSKVLVDASASTYIDFDVLELIKEFKEVQSKEKNIQVVLTGFKEEYNLENDSHVHSVQSASVPLDPQLFTAAVVKQKTVLN